MVGRVYITRDSGVSSHAIGSSSWVKYGESPPADRKLFHQVLAVVL